MLKDARMRLEGRRCAQGSAQQQGQAGAGIQTRLLGVETSRTDKDDQKPAERRVRGGFCGDDNRRSLGPKVTFLSRALRMCVCGAACMRVHVLSMDVSLARRTLKPTTRSRERVPDNRTDKNARYMVSSLTPT